MNLPSADWEEKLGRILMVVRWREVRDCVCNNRIIDLEEDFRAMRSDQNTAAFIYNTNEKLGSGRN